MTIVRNAIEADRLPLFKLAVAMHGETDFRHLRFNPEKALQSLHALIHDPMRLLLVAEHEGEVVGMLAACRLDLSFSDDPVAAEELFYVAPEHRGGMAAFKLIHTFVGWADLQGMKQVRAGVATGIGRAAERLYQHFGLRYVGGNFSKFL